MIYFTSDLHFCHSNIINLCNRPFKNYMEMHNMLIDNWNKRINENDSIYILGDFMINNNSSQANDILKKLNGNKYMIRGNHDVFLDEIGFEISLFNWIKWYHVLSYEGYKFVLFHYPILDWEDMHKGTIHLHGHTHKNEVCSFDNNKFFSYNVCVDCNDFYPVSIEEILNNYLKI